MKKPKTAVLDGDILVYKAAFWADMEGIDELPDRLKYDVKKWTPKGCKPVLAFSCPRSQNFRKRFWPDYKAHRDDTMQPDSKDYAVEIIVDGFDVVEYPQLEADDIMGIEASAGMLLLLLLTKISGVYRDGIGILTEKRNQCLSQKKMLTSFSTHSG